MLVMRRLPQKMMKMDAKFTKRKNSHAPDWGDCKAKEIKVAIKRKAATSIIGKCLWQNMRNITRQNIFVTNFTTWQKKIVDKMSSVTFFYCDKISMTYLPCDNKCDKKSQDHVHHDYAWRYTLLNRCLNRFWTTTVQKSISPCTNVMDIAQSTSLVQKWKGSFQKTYKRV